MTSGGARGTVMHKVRPGTGFETGYFAKQFCSSMPPTTTEEGDQFCCKVILHLWAQYHCPNNNWFDEDYDFYDDRMKTPMI